MTVTTAHVLHIVARAHDKGISIIFITHNVPHAYPVGDSFTLLDRGRSMGTFNKPEISRDEVLRMMARGPPTRHRGQTAAPPELGGGDAALSVVRPAGAATDPRLGSLASWRRASARSS